MAREGIEKFEDIFNCQVLDKYNLTDTKVPSVLVKGGYIRFNMNALHLLGDTPFVEILVNPDEKYMLVVPCGQYDVFAVDWCKTVKKTGRVAPREMRSKYLSPKLFKLMGWDPDNSYRVQCFYQSFDNGKCLLFFDLTEYVTMVSTTFETDEGKVKKRTKPYYLAEWQDSFGPPLHEIADKVGQDFMGYYVEDPNKDGDDEDGQLAMFERNQTGTANQ